MLKGKKNVNKTVKHCAVCQENFGDRFSFCPVCGEPLQAVQPVAAVQNDEIFNNTPPAALENTAFGSEQVAATNIPATGEVTTQFAAPIDNGSVKAEEIKSAAINSQPKKVILTKTAVNSANHVKLSNSNVPARDGLYHLTMLQAPKNYSRVLTTGAMIGLFTLMTTFASLMIYDIFTYPLDIAAIESNWGVTPVYTADDPQEEEEVERKNTDKGGGGGGGGNNNPKPPSKGVDAAQMQAPPVIRPSVDIYKNDNFELKQQATTVGNQPKKEEGPYGIKSSNSTDPSDGPGTGGGQGIGIGGGQGSGDGTGKGSGKGSGSGDGNGNGNGNGQGDGDNARRERESAPTIPPRPVETVKLAITSKPRATYTEDARKNQTQGTVRVRVTFGANGQIASVSAISGLPYGLTEQALSAARRISFTPEKRNGVGVPVTKVIEYNFNLY